MEVRKDSNLAALASSGEGGLDMSPEARKARAEEMGFDTSRTYYHGTAVDFEEFSATAPQNFHIRLPGIFFTDNPRAASAYAWSVGMKRADPQLLADPSVDLSYPSAPDARIIPVYLRMRNPIVIDLSLRADKGHTPPSAVREILSEVQSEGRYDSVILRNWKDGSGPTQYIVFDPSNIRSVNAAFDPSQEG